MDARIVVSTVDQYLLAPAPARRLGFLRATVGAYTVGYLWTRRRMLGRINKTNPDLFRPVGLARVLRRPLSDSIHTALVTGTLATGAAFTLGAGYRVTGPAFGGLLLWTLSYRNSWSMIYHSDNALVFHVLALGLARSADATSLDALAGRMLGKATVSGENRSWAYGWPIQMMNTVTAATYFVAGVAKLAGPLGPKWASGDVLRSQIAADAIRKEYLGEGEAALGRLMYLQLPLLRLLAVISLLVELGAPIALVNPRLGRLWALGAWGMHAGILAMMGIKFRYQLSGIMYASFVPVEKLAEHAGQFIAPGLPR